ncbi:MAG: dTDP-4-dehydrorhamnose reductase [Gemmataceae bacterium]
MKYALIGAAGQLGRDLVSRLPGDVMAWTRAEADLTKPAELKAKLEEYKPEIVINCAAYNFVDRAESEPEAAFAVNTWGVRNLATICAERDSVLVHFSTDYVFGFDQNRSFAYVETDPPGPLSVYGLSKLAGEYAVRALCPRHFVIRTCGLYGVWGSGGKGGNFVDTMLWLASQGKPLRVVNDQICTPTYTVDLAQATLALLKTKKYGLYHLTNAGACSWYEFARAIFEIEGIDANLTAIPTSEYPTPARRPGCSVLSCAAYEALSLPPMRSWKNALGAYLQERRKR